ncbi:MAG: methylenetetrahydrofolate reductase [NAD(P)H] [Eubacterium sp.]|nr:methylenetetrahydrofolate reductase [NAD(P)H] [Eubacterium sp.]
MKIGDILKNNRVTVSFEVFPPKQWDKIESTKKTVREMSVAQPSFMSVTYGASGTQAGFTLEIAEEIRDSGMTPLSHLTCVTSSRDKIHRVVGDLKSAGVENILALRGDIPEGFEFPDTEHFEHASELITEIKSLGDFCVGAACYPEIHPESKNRVEDIEYLKHKVDCGAEFLTSQMFFDNGAFLNFVEMCRVKGIEVPVIAGIMPITNARQIKRSIELSNCSVPEKFYKIMERFGDEDASMQQAGIIYATEQIIDLMANGINNIHIYTMNKPAVALQIMNGLSEIIK